MLNYRNSTQLNNSLASQSSLQTTSGFCAAATKGFHHLCNSSLTFPLCHRRNFIPIPNFDSFSLVNQTGSEKPKPSGQPPFDRKFRTTAPVTTAMDNSFGPTTTKGRSNSSYSNGTTTTTTITAPVTTAAAVASTTTTITTTSGDIRIMATALDGTTREFKELYDMGNTEVIFSLDEHRFDRFVVYSGVIFLVLLFIKTTEFMLRLFVHRRAYFEYGTLHTFRLVTILGPWILTTYGGSRFAGQSVQLRGNEESVWVAYLTIILRLADFVFSVFAADVSLRGRFLSIADELKQTIETLNKTVQEEITNVTDQVDSMSSDHLRFVAEHVHGFITAKTEGQLATMAAKAQKHVGVLHNLPPLTELVSLPMQGTRDHKAQPGAFSPGGLHQRVLAGAARKLSGRNNLSFLGKTAVGLLRSRSSERKRVTSNARQKKKSPRESFTPGLPSIPLVGAARKRRTSSRSSRASVWRREHRDSLAFPKMTVPPSTPSSTGLGLTSLVETPFLEEAIEPPVVRATSELMPHVVLSTETPSSASVSEKQLGVPDSSALARESISGSKATPSSPLSKDAHPFPSDPHHNILTKRSCTTAPCPEAFDGIHKSSLYAGVRRMDTTIFPVAGSNSLDPSGNFPESPAFDGMHKSSWYDSIPRKDTMDFSVAACNSLGLSGNFPEPLSKTAEFPLRPNTGVLPTHIQGTPSGELAFAHDFSDFLGGVFFRLRFGDAQVCGWVGAVVVFLPIISGNAWRMLSLQIALSHLCHLTDEECDTFLRIQSLLFQPCVRIDNAFQPLLMKGDTRAFFFQTGIL